MFGIEMHTYHRFLNICGFWIHLLSEIRTRPDGGSPGMCERPPTPAMLHDNELRSKVPHTCWRWGAERDLDAFCGPPHWLKKHLNILRGAFLLKGGHAGTQSLLSVLYPQKLCQRGNLLFGGCCQDASTRCQMSKRPGGLTGCKIPFEVASPAWG